MTQNDVETDELMQQAAAGDAQAREALLARYRARLRRMVGVRLDDRVAARVDASDVVQDTLLNASLKLEAYLHERPLPFYPWLHRLALEQIAHVHRHNLQTQARGVGRELETRAILSNATSRHLIDHLAASQTSPSQHASRKEQRARLDEALSQLVETDREVLVMRYLEDLPFGEIAAVLSITANAAKVRHFRALERLRPLLDEETSSVGR
jgi:RNA polymerase sigma-70 factor, ECF subfamily